MSFFSIFKYLHIKKRLHSAVLTAKLLQISVQAGDQTRYALAFRCRLASLAFRCRLVAKMQEILRGCNSVFCCSLPFNKAW